MSDYIITLDELMQCNGRTVALDSETTGLLWHQDKLIGVGVYCKEIDLIGYVPTLEDEDRVRMKEALSSLSSSTTIIMHNAKFDLHFMGMNPRVGGWNLMDTSVMVHLLDSRNKKAMKDAERNFLGTNSKRNHVEAAPARTKIWNWPLHILSAYCANDCLVTYQLAETLFPRLQEEGLEKLFWKDMRYLKILWSIERYGLLLDEPFIHSSASKLHTRMENLEQELYDRCGRTFNWRSPQQLSKAIYEGLGIPKPKNPFADADGVDRSRFADGGKYKSTCTSTFILTEKEPRHPLGELISSLRECLKLERHLEKYLELSDENKVIHTNFNLTGTRTGRLSSSKPNLQNVAAAARGRFTQSVYTGSVKRTDEFNVRRSIIARPGFVFVGVDYKQMEMRMFGILSGDPFMLKALISGKDVHMEIALKVWGDCGEEMNRVHREWSKTITFGLIYGMTLGSLQYKLNMTKMEAAKITDQYWGEFPRIKPWMNEIIDSCRMQGFVRYWSGRIWREENPLDSYKGCNALIQGGCADLLSIAVIRVDEWLRKQSDHHIVNLVHDEIIAEIPEYDALRSAREISTRMEVEDLFKVPFSTDVKIGRSYGEMIKIPKTIIFDESIGEPGLNKLVELAEPHSPQEPAKEEEDEDQFIEELDEEYAEE